MRRHAVTNTFFQQATARIQANTGSTVVTKTQTAHGRITKRLTKTQSATANISTGLDFLSQTSWPRPTFTPIRNRPFSDAATLSSLLSTMQPGDRIYYNGTGVLNISGSSHVVGSGAAGVVVLNNHNPSSPVVIDLGVKQSIWAPSLDTLNYVSIQYTGTATGWAPLLISNCSNLYIYGGEMNAGVYAGAGVSMWGPVHNCYVWDTYIHDIGGSGVSATANTTGGVSSVINNNNTRVEVSRFSMNPAMDPHADKGTGSHGFILHPGSAGGDYHNNVWTGYCHDSLVPGAISAGQVWPEGGGGSACENGMSQPSFVYNNETYYIKGQNLLMTPMHTGCVNPGSTSAQTAGNVFDAYGSTPQNGGIIGWAEGINCTGSVVRGSGLHVGSPPLTVKHGRHTNVNQYTGTGNISVPYDPNFGIVYEDCI